MAVGCNPQRNGGLLQTGALEVLGVSFSFYIFFSNFISFANLPPFQHIPLHSTATMHFISVADFMEVQSNFFLEVISRILSDDHQIIIYFFLCL